MAEKKSESERDALTNSQAIRGKGDQRYVTAGKGNKMETKRNKNGRRRRRDKDVRNKDEVYRDRKTAYRGAKMAKGTNLVDAETRAQRIIPVGCYIYLVVDRKRQKFWRLHHVKQHHCGLCGCHQFQSKQHC